MWRISDFSTSVMWNFFFWFPHNCHTLKAGNSPHFSPRIILVLLVTNMKSGLSATWHILYMYVIISLMQKKMMSNESAKSHICASDSRIHDTQMSDGDKSAAQLLLKIHTHVMDARQYWSLRRQEWEKTVASNYFCKITHCWRDSRKQCWVSDGIFLTITFKNTHTQENTVASNYFCKVTHCWMEMERQDARSLKAQHSTCTNCSNSTFIIS